MIIAILWIKTTNLGLPFFFSFKMSHKLAVSAEKNVLIDKSHVGWFDR